MAETRAVIIIGAGGHAKVLVNSLHLCGVALWGATSPDTSVHGKSILGLCPINGTDELLLKRSTADTVLVNGIGMTTPESALRQETFLKWKARGFSFATVVHPSAILAPDVVLGEGAQIMAGVVIQPGTRIGENTIVNSSASVDHDCIVGAHSHIAPGAVLCGGIVIGNRTMIGARSTVIQEIKIGGSVLIGAGAVVTANVADGARLRGVPAKPYSPKS